MALGSPITRAQGRLTPGARARRSPRLNASPATSKANNQDEVSLINIRRNLSCFQVHNVMWKRCTLKTY